MFIEPGSPWENGYIELFRIVYIDEGINRAHDVKGNRDISVRKTIVYNKLRFDMCRLVQAHPQSNVNIAELPFDFSTKSCGASADAVVSPSS